MRWVGQVAPRLKRFVFWWRCLEKRAHLGCVGLGRIILNQILKKQNRRAWAGVNWLMVKYVASSLDKVVNH